MMILAPIEIDSAELIQMIGCELGIEEVEAPGFQAGDQVDEGDFRCVAGAREHAFAEKCRA